MQTDKKFIMQIGVMTLIAFLIGLGISGLIWGLKPARVYETKVYENKDLHLKFSYLDLYFLTEEKKATTSSLFLLADTKENRDIVSFGNIKTDDLSGAIFIESFERNGFVDIAEWVKSNTKQSHFDSSNPNIETALVDDKKIVSYNWSDHLEGNTLAFINEGRVYLFTVASSNESDRIYKDFVSLVSTLELI